MNVVSAHSFESLSFDEVPKLLKGSMDNNRINSWVLKFS